MAITMIGLGICLEVGDGSSDLSWLPLLLILIYIVSTEHSPRDFCRYVLLYTNTAQRYTQLVKLNTIVPKYAPVDLPKSFTFLIAFPLSF